MRKTLFAAITFFILGCNNQQKKVEISTKDTIPARDIPDTNAANKIIHYTTAQKIQFFDSVSQLNSQPLKDSLAHTEDSTFLAGKKLNVTLSEKDYEYLKAACARGQMDLPSLKRIFPRFQESAREAGDSVEVELIKFNGYDEYAVSIGTRMGWGNYVYFFKKNKQLASHSIFHRYGLNIKHFKAEDGRTVIYYKANFGSGSGVWQFNYYFYKYYDDELVPVLNVLENSVLNWPSPRWYWLETIVTKTKPLTLKFEYHFKFTDSIEADNVNDETTVAFNFDSAKRMYVGDYSLKLNENKITSYYLGNNDLLFINAYQNELRGWLNGKDQTARYRTLEYLNEVMNYVLPPQ